MSKPWRNPDPFLSLRGTVARHIKHNCLPKRGRTLSDIHHDIDHSAANSANQLPHIGVPLKMETAHRPGFRVAFITLDELNVFHESHSGMFLEVTTPIMLGKVSTLIAKALEFYDFYGSDCQCT